MGVLDDLREKNRNTLNEKEKMLREIQKQTPKKTTQKTPQKLPESPQRKEKKTNGQQRGEKHKLDAGAKAIQEKAIKENAFPQAAVRFNERLLNDGVLAPVSIPYQIATGKKLLDFGLEADSDSAKKGAAVGNFLGTAAAYGTGYAAAGKVIGKGAGKVLATEAAKKGTAKLAASKIGKKAGKETVEKVAEGIARNLVGDATVGTIMNLSAARGEGLEGKELAKDMAINAAMDFGLGNAFEFVPMAWKAGKNAIKNTKVEPRIVDGRVKNVRVKAPEVIPQAPGAYKVKTTGSVNQRLGPKQAETIPYAPGKSAKTLTPEAEEKIFRAVEQRSGAKITYADLPEGIDGTYQNGVITISNRSSNPAYTVLKHELTHHIETSGHYAELSNFIQNSMRDAGYNVDQSINDIISDYARAGKNLTAEEAQKEFTAKFAEEYLFNSEKSIERLARENPNIFRQIYDWIVDTIHKIGASEETKFLIDAQRKYEKALRTIGKTEDAGIQYMFHKASAEDALKAEQMKNAGASEAEIKARLNLHQDARGEWISELSDNNARLYSNFDARLYNSNSNYKRYADMWKNGDILSPEFAKLDEIYRNVAKQEGHLDEILQHDELYSRYPQLKDTRVAIRNLPSEATGGFNPKTNEIVLADRMAHDDDIMSTLLHEVQHNIQNIEGRNGGSNLNFAEEQLDKTLTELDRSYKELSKAQDNLFDKEFEPLYNQATEKGYQESGEAYSFAEYLDELNNFYASVGDTVSAKKVQEIAVKNKAIEAKMSSVSKEQSKLRKLSPLEVYTRNAGEVEARQTAQSRFYSEADRRKRVPEKGLDFGGADGARTAGNDPATGNIAYSLKAFEDGKRFVDIDTDTSAFDGLSLREQGKLAVKIIKEKYAGKVVGIDNPIFVNGAGAGEFGFPLNKLGNTEHSAKMKSATELDNMFDAGHNFRNVPDGADGHVHKDVTGGFDYHDVIFKVGDRYYEGRINVKNTDRGKLFKDITKIKDVTKDISSSYGSNPKSTFLRTSSMNSIEPSTQNVNKKTEQYTKTPTKPLDARVTGDALLDAQDTVDLVKDIGGQVDENGYVTLYHRTSKENAERIRNTGKMSAKEDGVFFSTAKSGHNDGYGDAVVEFKVPAEKLILDDIFENEAHFRIPLKNRKEILDMRSYITGTSLSTGKKLQKDELLNQLRKTSENLYGETGNKYLQEIPLRTESPARKEPQLIPYAQRNVIQPIPDADTIPKTRKTASEAPDITTDERWDYMLENAPGERHARKLTEEEWAGIEMQGQEEAKARSGVTDEQINTFLNREPKTETKTSQKAKQYQKRKIRAADQEMRQALGINKYSNNKYIKEQMNLAMEKMKDGTLTKADKDNLFNEMFAEGIVVDQDFALKYQNLKQTIRSTQLNVPESVRKNIADFSDFRKSHMNKVRMSNTDGANIDIFYDELRSSYPELFPELNTPEEMLEKIADVADSIKVAETRVSADADADAIYTEARKRFDEVMDDLELEANAVKQYTIKRETDFTTDEMMEFAGQLGKMKRNAEKVKSKVILSDADKKFKDMLLDRIMTPDDVRRASLNSQNIFEVYNAEKPVYEMKKAIKEYGQKTKDAYKETADSVLKSSDKWNDKIGFGYARETPERNFVDIAGKEAGENINKEFITPIHEHEALATKMKTALREEVKALNVSTKKAYDATKLSLDAPGLSEQVNQARDAGKQYKISEAEIVQLYGEGLIDKEAINSLGADFEKIQKSVDTMRKLYNQLLEAANNELLRHGYEPIEFRKDYFPHFTEEKPDGILAKAAAALGIDIKKEELPTDINGLTHTFRPGKKWFGHALQRTSKVTEYDAIKGFDIYLEGIADVIHHTEDIQKLRALESELRFKYSDDGIKDRIRKIKNSDMDDSVKDELMRSIYDTGNTQLGSLATWLRNYTDQLAGKKSQFDRVFEQGIGRTLYNSSKAIENRVAANMVALNPGSWLTNFIPLVQAGEISPKYILQGMAETVQNGFRKADNIADISSFLTNRKGSDALWKTGSEKIQNTLTKPMEWIDTFTSQALVRAKYAEQIAKGANPEDAIKTADRFAADIIADRSKGALPTMFNSKNPISKIFTMYQVEVNNQWSHLLKDIPRSKENVAKVALAFTNFAIGAYIFNDVYERIVGRRPALDPISWANDYVGDTTGKKLPNFTEALQAAMKGEGISLEEVQTKKGGAAITSIGENIAQDIPFIGGILGGGRVPISSALPSGTTIATNIGNLSSGDVAPEKAWSAIGKELAKPATYIVPPVGGGQIKKAVESGIALKKGGSYGMDNEGNEKLRFAVDKDPLSVAKGLLFGQYAIGNSGDYVESGFKMLSADKTKAYQALVAAGMKNTEAEQFIRSLPSKTTEMRKAILNSDLTTKQKQAVGNVLDEKQIDYSSKESYTYSLMSDSQKKAVTKLKRSGMSEADAKKVYEVTREYKSGAEQVNALLEAGYHEAVMKKLGIGEKSVERGKALHSAGIENETYIYNKNHADANSSGNVSIKEAKAYLDRTAYTRKEKYALMKALTGCADKNNPYR